MVASRNHSREANVTLTTDNGTQFTSSRFLETLGRLGITHRRTAYHHPEGNSYIERFVSVVPGWYCAAASPYAI